jgi:hypothetical protein
MTVPVILAFVAVISLISFVSTGAAWAAALLLAWVIARDIYWEATR